MAEITLANLLDDAALLSLEHQIHLSEVAGDRPWSVDLAGAGRFTFTGDQPIEAQRVHLLGSAAPGPASFLWSWANPSGYSEEVTGLAKTVRDFGIRHGIRELADPEVPFSALPGSPSDPPIVAAILMDAAKAVCGLWTSYTGPVGGGTRAAFLIEHPSFLLPAPTGPRIATILRRGLSLPTLQDHRRALYSYVTKRGLQGRPNADWSQLDITGPGITATVAFDRYARTTNIDIRMDGPSDTGELLLATAFDGRDPQGRPIVNRPPVDPRYLDRVLHYLQYAPVVLAARSRDTDDFDPAERDVPMNFHTDGVFVWPGAVPHYLRKYGVPPEPALVQHIIARNFEIGEVDDAARQAAVARVTS
ncbi:DUF6882 domain-containing protein [Nocardia higoensis]|uniref:DUF6882 domain-containing protein n=1 Tax=Nocardia higoensis TaxID=228599 RepID=UPI0002F561F3|nr:DUF6882 domain-containing protein [Nocardia higoensis]